MASAVEAPVLSRTGTATYGVFHDRFVTWQSCLERCQVKDQSWAKPLWLYRGYTATARERRCARP